MLYCAVAALLLHLCIGSSAMAALLCRLCYGGSAMAALLGRLCYGSFAMAALLWWQPCYGNKCQKTTYFLIHIAITTIITVTTITTVTTVYNCLQPIQRFNRTATFLLILKENIKKTPSKAGYFCKI